MNKIVDYPLMLSVRQAAEKFGLSPAFVRKLCREGSVRFVAVGRTRWLVNERSLVDFLERGSPIPAAQSDPKNGIRKVQERGGNDGQNQKF